MDLAEAIIFGIWLFTIVVIVVGSVWFRHQDRKFKELVRQARTVPNMYQTIEISWRLAQVGPAYCIPGYWWPITMFIEP